MNIECDIETFSILDKITTTKLHLHIDTHTHTHTLTYTRNYTVNTYEEEEVTQPKMKHFIFFYMLHNL